MQVLSDLNKVNNDLPVFAQKNSAPVNVCWLTQVNAIQMGASLLCHIHIHIEEDHWVPKVLPRTRVKHQHGIMGCGVRERLLVSVWTFSSIQHLADAETPPCFGAHHPRWGVRQDGQNFFWVTWKVLEDHMNQYGDTETCCYTQQLDTHADGKLGEYSSSRKYFWGLL